MIHDLLNQAPGPVTVPVIARITKLVRKQQGGEGERAWQFQAIKLEDASGSIEAKVWNKQDVVVGSDIELGLNGQGTGLTIEDDPKYGRKLIVQGSATMTPHGAAAGNDLGGAVPQQQAPEPPPQRTTDTPAYTQPQALDYQPQTGTPLPGSGLPGLPNPAAPAYQPPPPVDFEKERDKAILANADLVIRVYESVVRHVAPKVKESTGYEMSGDEIRAAVESITIYSQKDLRS